MDRYAQLAAQLEDLAKQDHSQLLAADDQIRRRLLDAIQNVLGEFEAPQDTARRIQYTPTDEMAAKIGIDLKVFEQLSAASQPLDSKQIASNAVDKGADPELVYRLLKHMSAVGLIREVGDDKWAANNVTRNLAMRGVAAGVIVTYSQIAPAWVALPGWLKRHKYWPPTSKTDTAFVDAMGEPLFPWYENHPESAAFFNEFMIAHRRGIPSWLEHVDFEAELAACSGRKLTPDGVTFVDIGGGVGHVCADFKKRLPNVPGRVILEDQPSVVAQALATPGVEAQGIDFFTEQPVRGAAVYYFRSVLVDWPDAESRQILAQTVAAAADDSLILLDEMVSTDSSGSSGSSSTGPRGPAASRTQTQLDMVMLAAMNAVVRSQRRWQQLLAAAGLHVLKWVPYNPRDGNTIIVTRKASV